MIALFARDVTHQRSFFRMAAFVLLEDRKAISFYVFCYKRLIREAGTSKISVKQLEPFDVFVRATRYSRFVKKFRINDFVQRRYSLCSIETLLSSLVPCVPCTARW